MLPTEVSQQYLSFSSNPQRPRSRQPTGISGSIWAPQPQPSEGTWPRTLDSFSRVVERDFEPRGVSMAPLVTREDVFGPAVTNAPMPNSRQRDVGAIGDGRKMNTSDFDDSHVEQLLRTLNLNSPAPYNAAKKPPLNLHFDISPNSPDFSPASATSALLTPTDLSPGKPVEQKLPGQQNFDIAQSLGYLPPSSLLFDPSPRRLISDNHSGNSPYRSSNQGFPIFEPFSDNTSSAFQNTFGTSQSIYTAVPSINANNMSPPRRPEFDRLTNLDWRLLSGGQNPISQQSLVQQDWMDKMSDNDYLNNLHPSDAPTPSKTNFSYQQSAPSHTPSHEPINFLSLLHPSSSPPYHVFVARIIKSSDQQASIFLQQKLKVADSEERAKIVDAICARGFEMMAHRFGNWAVQRCLEAASSPEERRKIVCCMKGRIVELATNCYGCHVLQKALDCEEDIRLLIVSELLLGDPAQTLVNKHASHVWSKIMELSWTPPAPPIFQYVNKSLKGKWASLACHETGSLVVQHAFENLEDEAKDGIIDELLNRGPAVFAEVAKNQWGSYCVQHILEHGSEKHRQMTLGHLLDGLLDFATNEQGAKSVTKSLKEGGKETLARVVRRMCEPAKGGRRAMIVDLALSVTGSQLIASVLPTADKDQRAALYECIRGHIVTLRGCKTGSKVIWLFDRMRAYYGY